MDGLAGQWWWECGERRTFVGGAFNAFHDGSPVHYVLVVYGSEGHKGGIRVGLVGF